MISSSELRIEATTEECSDLGNGSVASASPSVYLFKKKIEFQPARKPFNVFKSCGGGDFRIETLNPGPDQKRVNGVGSGQLGLTGRKVDGTDMWENGLDPVLSLRTTFRKIVSFSFDGFFSICNLSLKFCFMFSFSLVAFSFCLIL